MSGEKDAPANQLRGRRRAYRGYGGVDSYISLPWAPFLEEEARFLISPEFTSCSTHSDLPLH